jgi:WD repeat-containing protein 68
VPDSQVITHTAPWLIYSLGFSAHPAYPYRLAIGSFKEEVANEIHIVQLNMEGPNQMFEKKAGFIHNYPATKLIWIPDKEGSSPDLLATSG